MDAGGKLGGVLTGKPSAGWGFTVEVWSGHSVKLGVRGAWDVVVNLT